jgi:hypothetical protein
MDCCYCKCREAQRSCERTSDGFRRIPELSRHIADPSCICISTKGRHGVQWCWQERTAPVTVTNSSKPPEIYCKRCRWSVSLYLNMETSLFNYRGGSQPLEYYPCMCTVTAVTAVYSSNSYRSIIRPHGVACRKVRTTTSNVAFLGSARVHGRIVPGLTDRNQGLVP